MPPRRPGCCCSSAACRAGPARIGLYVVDIEQVDDADQSFRTDLFAILQWTDPRLASAVLASGYDECRFLRAEVWTPQLVLLNRRDVDRQLDQRVSVNRAGAVEFVYRFRGVLRSPFELREFPLDAQRLPVSLVSMEYGPEELNLEFDGTAPVHAGELVISGWRVEREVHRVRSLDTKSTSSVSERFARFDYEFHVTRELGYYVWRVIVPLTFIVLMSWAVFWIDPDMAGVQIGLAATSILTLIAFLFSLNAILPRLSYLTRMDVFLFASLAIVFVAFAEAVATAILTNTNREGLALRLDRAARWVFPLFFAAIHLVIWNA